MRLISNRVLREFAHMHADAETPLQAWHRLIEKGTYRNFAELRATFASADKVGDRIVFNIGGNKYRLVAAVLFWLRPLRLTPIKPALASTETSFSVQQVFVKAVLTHADYDKGEWK